MKNIRTYITVVFFAFNFLACTNSDDISENENLYRNTPEKVSTEGTQDDVKKTRNCDPEL